MNQFIRIFIFCITLNLFLSASEDYETLKKERMLGDLEFIKNILQTNYAPAGWKKQCFGWDLDDGIAEVKNKVMTAETISTKEFQRLVNDFFKSMKDYHAKVFFYSTASSTLPFRIQSVNRKCFFSYIDSKYTSAHSEFPFSEGDELLLIDGEPADAAIEELLKRETGNNNKDTDRALAELYLTTRVGSFGQKIPSGDITLTGYKKEDSRLVEHQMKWKHRPEKISNTVPIKRKTVFIKNKFIQQDFFVEEHQPISSDHFFKKSFLMPEYEAIAKLRSDDFKPKDMIGSKKSCIPILGKILWQSSEDSLFDAYLFEMKEQKVGGYIRIASYSPDDPDEAAKEFAEIINLFQKKSDALVIDQINNPGGYVLYLYALASMLSDKALIVPKHRVIITQEDLFFAVKESPALEEVSSDEDAQNLFGDTVLGLSVSFEFAKALREFNKFIVNEWDSGHHFTWPLNLYGVGPIFPSPRACYKKPILLLINSLDFSGGDFFPAIFQDNSRAILMGTRTAGAGGCVVEVEFPNLSGISHFRYTSSIAERSNHNIIENLGVTPDIMYTLSEADLQHGYVEYKEKILDVLHSHIYSSQNVLQKLYRYFTGDLAEGCTTLNSTIKEDTDGNSYY